VDNFNNPRLNQAVAEDQLLLLSFIFPRINKPLFRPKLGRLSTTDRYARRFGKSLQDEPVGRGNPELTVYD
jgi:hypothetical protein